eukprot:2784280-Amphidinium_carterae.1
MNRMNSKEFESSFKKLTCQASARDLSPNVEQVKELGQTCFDFGGFSEILLDQSTPQSKSKRLVTTLG